MGFFSSSTVVNVASTAVNLVQDPGDTNTASVIASVLGGTNIAQDLVENNLDSIVLKARRALEYGESTYSHGLPAGTLQKAVGNTAALETVLEGIAGGPIRIISSIVQICDNVEYTWPDETTTGGLTSGEMYYFVSYILINTDGTTLGVLQNWLYRISTGTYPTLAVGADDALNSPYYPMVPLRRHNVDMTHSSKSGTDLYQTSEKLLELLGTDFTSLGEGINANPDVADIDHATVMFGVDLSSTVPASVEYMYEYFLYLHQLKQFTSLDFALWSKSNLKNGFSEAVTAVNINDTYLHMQVAFTHSDLDVITGSIGSIDTVTKTVTVLPRKIHYLTQDENSESKVRRKMQYETSYVTFRKQISTGKYMELIIHGLNHSNYIYSGHAVETTVALSEDPDNFNFILPLNQTIVQNMTQKQEMALMYDSVKIVFNSYTLTKVKWYQSGFFAIVVMVAAIVITVMSVGTASPWATAMVAAIGVTAGTVAFTVAALIMDMIIGQFIMYAFELFAEVLGIENTFLIAIASFAATAYLSMGKDASGKSLGLAGAPWAQEMLMVSNGLLAGIQARIAEVAEELADDYTAFWEYTDNEMDRLEEAQATYDASNASELLDPYTFVNPIAFDPNETPDQFYSRTIHAGNIGVLSLDSTASYVANSLRLPSTIDSGSFNNLLGV